MTKMYDSFINCAFDSDILEFKFLHEITVSYYKYMIIIMCKIIYDTLRYRSIYEIVDQIYDIQFEAKLNHDIMISH